MSCEECCNAQEILCPRVDLSLTQGVIRAPLPPPRGRAISVRSVVSRFPMNNVLYSSLKTKPGMYRMKRSEYRGSRALFEVVVGAHHDLYTTRVFTKCTNHAQRQISEARRVRGPVRSPSCFRTPTEERMIARCTAWSCPMPAAR